MRLVARRRVDLEDRRAALLLVEAVLAHVAVGANGYIELLAVLAGDDILGPVVVDGPARQVRDLLARRRDILSVVVEAHQRIRVRDIESIAYERHPEGRIEPGQEWALDLGDPVAVAIAQERDAVGACRSCATRALLEEAHEPRLETIAFLGPRRRVGLGDEDVAIRQHIEPARMIEILGEGRNLQATSGGGRSSGGPALRRRDVDGRDEGTLRLRELRVGTEARRVLLSGRRRREKEKP